MWCGEDPEAWKQDATGGWMEPYHADGWKGEPKNWFELIFGVGYVALRNEIDREIGPEYRMHLEMLD
jgi:hypothetical protein